MNHQNGRNGGDPRKYKRSLRVCNPPREFQIIHNSISSLSFFRCTFIMKKYDDAEKHRTKALESV